MSTSNGEFEKEEQRLCDQTIISVPGMLPPCQYIEKLLCGLLEWWLYFQRVDTCEGDTHCWCLFAFCWTLWLEDFYLCSYSALNFPLLLFRSPPQMPFCSHTAKPLKKQTKKTCRLFAVCSMKTFQASCRLLLGININGVFFHSDLW